MRVVAIVQARMGSTRLPGKIMEKINGVSLISLLLSRLNECKTIDEIIVATSSNKENNILVDHVHEIGFKCLQGSEEDVLSRYVSAGEQLKADIIVRITGDCPLVDPGIVDKAVLEFQNNNVDYLSNTNPPSYPDGLDVEVFYMKLLQKVQKKINNSYDKEHVTTYLRGNKDLLELNIKNEKDLSKMRLTVDEGEDLEVVRNIFNYFSPNILFGLNEILELQKVRPDLFLINNKFHRNEGEKMNKGTKLWKRAKRVIPGGNMLFSKRPEMFLPEFWPTYYSKAEGCNIWDLDKNKYKDLSLMGVGTNILGYGNPLVDEAVRKTISNGNMSTLNCPEEVYLSEKLVEIHPWADMVRLARSGGEANSIGIRIARAATGKDKVAICGYHGWHDWYLSSNLQDKNNLSEHLNPGLETNGVPKALEGTVFTFNYNNFAELEKITDEHDLGVIKMEVQRNFLPEDNFLQKVRDLATKKGIVLIFDECTSGFRETYGGLHKKFGVEPDMAMFGKAMGNGYGITAIIGKEEIMQAAQTTFISSTFWTERIGPTAALETLKIMKDLESWKIITMKGKEIKKKWTKLAKEKELKLTTSGLDALASFSINSKKFLSYKTLISQEMLKKGFIASNSVYLSIAHTDEIIDEYFSELEVIFETIKQCEEGREISDLLDGEICHSDFKRLN